jgi:DNA-directed RNA polymerase sigma subunit (sigma70/sigma32)
MNSGGAENREHPWFDRESFTGLTDHDAEQLVLERLGSEPLLKNEEFVEYFAQLQHEDSNQRDRAQDHLRTYLLRLALGICGKYPPVGRSLPSAVAAIDTAIAQWDPSKGFSLGTYGSWFIRQAIFAELGQGTVDGEEEAGTA